MAWAPGSPRRPPGRGWRPPPDRRSWRQSYPGQSGSGVDRDVLHGQVHVVQVAALCQLLIWPKRSIPTSLWQSPPRVPPPMPLPHGWMPSGTPRGKAVPVPMPTTTEDWPDRARARCRWRTRPLYRWADSGMSPSHRGAHASEHNPPHIPQREPVAGEIVARAPYSWSPDPLPDPQHGITLPSVRRPTILVVEPPMSMPRSHPLMTSFQRPLGFVRALWWDGASAEVETSVISRPWLS